MLTLYKRNFLPVTEINEYSILVDGGDFGEIYLRDAPDDLEVGTHVEAFVYRDASDTVVATMAQAYAHAGECAYLEVVSTAEHGAFLDWGLPKDLFLPFAEQAYSVREGDCCVAYVYEDASGRPMASTRLHKHLNEKACDLEIGEAVDLLISGQSDLGYKAVINNQYLGLIFHSEISQPLALGTEMKGWIKGIRADGKINLNINALDGGSRDDLEGEIRERLVEAGGRIELSDKSAPDEIYAAFKVSKKNFKRAIGALYKQRIITISREYIELVNPSSNESD